MNKKFIRLFSLLMGVGLAFSMTACNIEFKLGKDKDTPVIDNTIKGGDALNDKTFDQIEDNTKEEVEDTDVYLYKDKATDYKIVIPADSVDKDTNELAASELKYFMNDATGITFTVISDDDASIGYEDGKYDFEKKYISIGDTEIFKQTDIKNDVYKGEQVFTEKFLGLDGFVIKTIGNTIVINAVGNNGKVYGVYGFLERNMDYRFYYKDEWSICKDPQKTVKKMDVIDMPEFQSRYLDTATNFGNIVYMMRVRQHGSQGSSITGGMEGGAWKLSDQSLCGELLYFDKYVPMGHGDWYSGDGAYRTGQMCVATVLENQYTIVTKKAVFEDAYKFSDGTYALKNGFLAGEDINLLETEDGFVYETAEQFKYGFKTEVIKAGSKLGETALIGSKFTVNADFTLTLAAADATENVITFNEGDIAYVLNVNGNRSYIPVDYEGFDASNEENAALLTVVTPKVATINGKYFTHKDSGRIIPESEYSSANFGGEDVRLRPDDIKPLDEMTKNLIDYIVKNPNARVFMLGINDNSTYQCKCEKCTPQVEKIRYSGQIVLLAKALQKNIRAWQNGEELPGVEPVSERDKNRIIKLSFFAYLYTIEAPTTRDDATGEYTRVPYDYDGDGDFDDLKCDEDIIVRIASIASVNMHTHYESDYNGQAYEAFKSWKEIVENFAVWDYGTTFADYISPYPDWGVIQDDFFFYRENNVTELLTQLPAHTSGTSFFALMIYLRSQLMWDMDQDVEWLMQDFFKHYYGPEAYDSMWAYFTFLRCYMQAADTKYKSPDGQTELNGFVTEDGNTVSYHGYIYEIFTQQKWFPFNTVQKLKGFFTQAISALDAAKDTEEKYETYYNRVQVESLFYRYMLLKNFKTEFSNEELSTMVDEFEKYANIGNLTQFNNGGKNGAKQVESFIASLRSELG